MRIPIDGDHASAASDGVGQRTGVATTAKGAVHQGLPPGRSQPGEDLFDQDRDMHRQDEGGCNWYQVVTVYSRSILPLALRTCPYSTPWPGHVRVPEACDAGGTHPPPAARLDVLAPGAAGELDSTKSLWPVTLCRCPCRTRLRSDASEMCSGMVTLGPGGVHFRTRQNGKPGLAGRLFSNSDRWSPDAATDRVVSGGARVLLPLLLTTTHKAGQSGFATAISRRLFRCVDLSPDCAGRSADDSKEKAVEKYFRVTVNV